MTIIGTTTVGALCLDDDFVDNATEMVWLIQGISEEEWRKNIEPMEDNNPRYTAHFILLSAFCEAAAIDETFRKMI